MRNSYFSRRGNFKKGAFLGVSALILIFGGFFIAQTAMAAHTATVNYTISGEETTYVKGGETDTYEFSITNNGADNIYKIRIEIPSSFTLNDSLSCPSGWVSAEGTDFITCTDETYGDYLINPDETGQISLVAISSGSDGDYSWTIKTTDMNSLPGQYEIYNPITTVDATPPTIQNAVSKDTDNNGSIDEVEITFSEPIDDSSITATDFSIDGTDATSFSTGEGAEAIDDNVITLTFGTEISGTEQKTLSYNSSAPIVDFVGNQMANSDTTTTDEATPVATSAKTKTTTTIEVTFSEDLDGTNNAATDFTVEGSTVQNASENAGVITLTLASPIEPDATPLITVLGDGAGTDNVGVKDINGNFTSEHTVEASDGIAPEILGAETLSTTEIGVQFTEPMSALLASDFTVGGNAIESATISEGDSTQAVLTLQTSNEIGTGETPNVETTGSPTGTYDNATEPNLITGNLTETPTDGISPTVEISSSADDPTNTSPISMTATFSEEVSGLEEGEIVISNGSVDAGSLSSGDNTTYSFNVTPAGDGEVTANIAEGSSEDGNANTNSASNTFSIEYDSTAPEVLELSHDHDDSVARDADTVTVTAVFNENMQSSPQISIDVADGDDADINSAMSEGVDASTWTYTWEVPAGHDGGATVTLSGDDLAGNAYAGSDSLSFTIDNTPPAASEITPVPTPTGDNTPDVVINVESGATWEIKNDSEILTDGTGTGADQTVTLPELSDEEYILNLVATDVAGNERTVALTTFRVDTTPPSVEAGADVITNSSFTQDATASDGGSGIASYSWTKTSGTGNVTFTDSSVLDVEVSGVDTEGSYTIQLTVTDNAGNSATDSFNLVWDITAPTVGVDSLLTNDTTPQLTGTINDNTATIEVTVNSETVEATNNGDGTWTLADDTLSELSEGVYDVSVSATDPAENTGTDDTTGELEIDTTNPTIDAFTAPAADTVYTTDPPLQFTASDSNGVTCSYSINGGAEESVACESGVAFSGDITGLTDGRNEIVLTITDGAGNTKSSDAVSFVYNNDGILTVDDSGADFTTIQAAIDGATAGDTINVAAGTYQEDLTIDKEGIDLTGADNTTTFIKGISTVDAGDWPLADANIEILASSVKIHGFTIQSPDYVSGYYSSGIVIGASNVEIYNNNFQINTVDSTDDISQTIQTYAESAMPGVDVSGLNIHNNEFAHQGARDWGYEGIYINPQDTPAGVVTIQDNQFTGNILRAVTSERSKTTIKDNTITTDQIPTPSDLSSPGSYQGINISGNNDTVITGNTIIGSNTGNGFLQGLKVSQALDVILTENTFGLDNTIMAKNTDGVNQLTAGENYWNTAVYSTINTKTDGDINFDPYYVDSEMTILSSTAVTEVYVDDDYTDGGANDGHYFGYDAFDNIQDGINAVESGGTVNVAAGTYAETVNVNKGVSLIGEGDSSIVNPTEDSNAIVVTSDNVLLKDLKVTTSNSGVSSNIAISIEEADNLEINDVTVETTGDKAMGIWAGGSSNGLDPVSNLTVVKTSVTIGGEATALYASFSSSAHSGWTIGGSEENGNTLIAESGNPLELYDVTSSEVSHNTITTSGTGGSAVIWSAELSDVSNITFDNNDVNYSGGSQVAFLANYFNAGSYSMNTVTITNNTLNNWGTRGLRIGDGVTSVTVSNNQLPSAGEKLKNEDSEELNAENNWWGTTDGPTIESSIIGNVDYRPWCTESACASTDSENPTVTISSTQSSPTNASPITIEIDFSENVSGLTEDEITLTNATKVANSFSGTGSAYILNITPDEEGAVNVDISADVAWDEAGNYNTAADQFSIEYDTTSPTLSPVSISSGNDDSTLAKEGDTITLTFTADEEIQTPTVNIMGNSITASNTSGNEWSASHTVTTEDPVGAVSFSIDFADLAGNTGTQVTDTTDGSSVTCDNAAPSGYSVSIDQDYANSGNETALSFTFAGAEIGATYNYSIDDATGNGPITGSGTISTETDQITGINVSALSDETLTLTVTLTDPVGNEGSPATDTVEKDTDTLSVLSYTPSTNAVNVEPAENIEFTFDENAVVEEGDITFSPSISGFTVENSGTNTITINPDSALESNTVYDVTLSGVTDEAGNTMADHSDVHFTTATHYDISLNADANGWNLISIPVVPNDTSISTVLGDASADIEAVWTYDPTDPNADDSGWLSYEPGAEGTNNLTNMTAGYGYWVSVSADTSITGSGSLLSAGPTAPPSRDLSSGWSLIGYYQIPGEDSSTPSNAFSSLGSDYTGLWGYDNSTGNFESVGTINQGDGFWISLQEGKTYTPSNN